MKVFIPISRFKQFYVSLADLFDDEKRGNFIKELSSIDEQTLLSDFQTSVDERNELLKSWSDPKTLLFYSWVESNASLFELFTKNKVHSFIDQQSLQKHASYSDFRKWISPFLANILLKQTAESYSDKAVLSTFLCLLDEDHALLLEQHFFKHIQSDLVALQNELENGNNETDFLPIVTRLCADDVIHMLNKFSKLSYVYKREFVEVLLDFIKDERCSVRLANWILKRLGMLALNEDHRMQIQELHQLLKSGQLKRNLPKKKSVTIGRTGILFGGLIILCGLFLYYTIKLSNTKQTEPDQPEKTSFSHFSKEERKQIDSLIALMIQPLEDVEENPDPTLYSGGSSNALRLRKAYSNIKMEELYDDLNKDAELALLQSYDSCGPKKKFECLPEVLPLLPHKHGQEALIRNESEYQIILFVAGPKPNDEVLSLMIKPGEEKLIKLQKGDFLTLVAGDHFTTYQAPANPLSELPSENFTMHFCVTDLNYSETINSPYFFQPDGKKAKFMVSGKKGQTVQLIDVYDVLKDY